MLRHLGSLFFAICIFAEPLCYASSSPTPSAPETNNEDLPDPPATPLPRFISAPRILYENTVEGGKEVTGTYSQSAFTVLGLLATWNPKSVELNTLLNKYSVLFREHGISLVVLFSHDTKFTLKEWKKLNKPNYQTELASINFIDEQKNPKVPTFWIANRRGQIVKFFELPSNNDLSSFFDKIIKWTEF